jgi:type VI secretion system secreted protein VgrG
VQAHSNDIELTAHKAVRLASVTDNIEAAAKQEILLTSGGAYVRIKDGNIEIHAPGARSTSRPRSVRSPVQHEIPDVL